MLAIMAIVSPFMLIIGTLAGEIISFLSNMIIDALAKQGFGFDDFANGITNGIDYIISYVGENILGYSKTQNSKGHWFDSLGNSADFFAFIGIIVSILAGIYIKKVGFPDAIGVAIGIFGLWFSIFYDNPDIQLGVKAAIGALISSIGLLINAIWPSEDPTIDLILLLIALSSTLAGLGYTLAIIHEVLK